MFFAQSTDFKLDFICFDCFKIREAWSQFSSYSVRPTKHATKSRRPHAQSTCFHYHTSTSILSAFFFTFQHFENISTLCCFFSHPYNLHLIRNRSMFSLLCLQCVAPTSRANNFPGHLFNTTLTYLIKTYPDINFCGLCNTAQ